ncbi:hypothetical protein Bb109J_c1267 [Bdellovibrio bacteriovorus]|uniref:CAP domain-containing protein n=1 Tax=Bdellovibrio bacteriovorus TaxID=959 RepID=UPI00045BE528|nr:CAP domain-containing protein [Bdellovibrio bacteriovorus]AHZ86600.1 transmembrane protein [Bdellovibrio bacteriovorus]BEV67847.1 hypothetical protein Bb109J_c1267 [Bdellovibrio bacteriovorus]
MTTLGIRVSFLFLFALALAACGGGGGSGRVSPAGGDSSEQESSGESNGSECGTMVDMACEVLVAVNQERTSRGLNALTALPACGAEAQAHADDMVARNYFAHDSPTESTSQRFARFGLSGSYWGENIAVGYSTAAQVMGGWMSSTGHRSNILSSNFRTMGVGIAANSQGMLHWVQCFSGKSAL